MSSTSSSSSSSSTIALPVPPPTLIPSYRLQFPPCLTSCLSSCSILSVDSLLHHFSTTPSFFPETNRPWARGLHRRGSGCIGEDFFFHHKAFDVEYWWHAEDSVLVGKCHFSERCEGPPKGAHGGAVAGAFDEFLAYPLWRTDEPAFTGQLCVNYRRMVPLPSTLAFFARIYQRVGKKVYMEGAIFDVQPKKGSTGTSSLPVDLVVYADSLSLWIVTEKIGPVNMGVVLSREGTWGEKEREIHQQGIYAYGRETKLAHKEDIIKKMRSKL